MMLMLLRLMCWIDYCCLRLLPFTSAVKTLELTVVTALRPRCYHSVCPKMCLHVALVTPAFRDVTALYRCSIRVGLPLSHAGVVAVRQVRQRRLSSQYLRNGGREWESGRYDLRYVSD